MAIDTNEKVAVHVHIAVPVDRMCDMVIGALEGGSHYWLNAFKLVAAGGADMTEKMIWYAHPTLYSDPDSVMRAEYDKPTDADPGFKLLGAADFAKGLQLMAEKSPSHFAAMVDENDDATTADVFMQYVVLGEIVYG